MNVLSFFSGLGGLDLGLQQAGMRIVSCCENNRVAAQSLSANWPDTLLLNDINVLTDSILLERLSAVRFQKRDIFLMCGGPPCQSFSTAGKRRAFDDARGNVFLVFINLCLAIRPPYILIENVRGLLSACDNDGDGKGKGSALLRVYNLLIEAGYAVSFNLYNTANYGVAQSRERLILVASLHGRVPYIAPTHCQNRSFGLPPWITLRECIADMEGTPEYIAFPPKRLRFFSMLSAGQNWRDLPPDVQREAMGGSLVSGGGKTGFFRRLSWDEPAPTLLTSPVMFATALAHPDENRPLSVQEYKRIQAFPDSWVVCGSTADKYRQLGNAVPVLFARCVGRAILEHAAGITAVIPPAFAFSRYANTDDQRWLAIHRKK